MSSKPKKISISKSDFLRGIKCEKSLWLKKRSGIKPQEPDEAQMALFEAGHEVGEYAKELFPGGIEIKFDPKNFPGMISETKELIGQGAEVIYEATFQARGGFARADILKKEKMGRNYMR